MKYAYEMGNIQGAQWLAIQDHVHKEICGWEIAGAPSRGIENSVESFLRIHNTTVENEQAFINAIEAGTMPGFRKVPDEIGVDLPILLYNEDELIDAKRVSFDEKWERIEKLGSYIESKLQAISQPADYSVVKDETA